MEVLPGNLYLDVPQGCFPLSTDSMVLADFVRLPKNAKVADLGAGCAALGLLLCSEDKQCHVTGFEAGSTSHAAALQNIARNALEDRMESVFGDLRQNILQFPRGHFDVCVSNPPYFSGGPDAKLKSARRDDLCTTEDLMQAMGYALKFGGDGFVVHKPEKLAELIAQGSRYGLEAKELVLVRHKEGSPTALILLKLRKGAKPGLILREMALRDKNDNYTDDYRRIYHMD